MNRCKPENMDTKGYGNMLRRILTQHKGLVNARGWKIEGQKRRVIRKECKRLREEFEVGGFAKWGCGTLSKKRMLEDRGAVPKEDGNFLRECQAMHEENFLSSWLREDVEGKEEEREKMNKEAKEEGS